MSAMKNLEIELRESLEELYSEWPTWAVKKEIDLLQSDILSLGADDLMALELAEAEMDARAQAEIPF